jgi:phospholipid transport system substrate-binding protein
MRPFENPGSARGPATPARGLAIGTVLTVILLSPSLSSAGVSPRGELEEFFGRATAIRSEATSEKQARDDVRVLARALFDGRTASREALGREWDHRTGAERDEFARAFTGVLERAYVDLVQARLPRDRPPAIRVLGEDVFGARVAVVRTKVLTRDGGDVQLDYKMSRPGKAWLIRDVVIDGVSLVENYRAQFARVLRRSSYVELLERVRTVAATGVEKSVAVSSRSGLRPDILDLAPVSRAAETP